MWPKLNEQVVSIKLPAQREQLYAAYFADKLGTLYEKVPRLSLF